MTIRRLGQTETCNTHLQLFIPSITHLLTTFVEKVKKSEIKAVISFFKHSPKLGHKNYCEGKTRVILKRLKW